MLQNPDARHFGYPLRRASGVRSAVMYRTLTRMLNDGWISDGWEDPRTLAAGHEPRRYYVLTATGREALADVVAHRLPPLRVQIVAVFRRRTPAFSSENRTHTAELVARRWRALRARKPRRR